MNSVKLAAVVVLLAGGMALGQAVVQWELDLGGNNRADTDPGGWEAGGNPAYIQGDPDDVTVDPVAGENQVAQGDILNWDAVVTAAGTKNGLGIRGIANLVFSVEVHAYSAGCVAEVLPDTTGTVTFQSTMNDGDNTGRLSADPLEMAAFTHIYNVAVGVDPTTGTYGTGNGPPGGSGQGRIWDPPESGGPHLARAQFPSTSTHSGGRIEAATGNHLVAGGIGPATTAANVLSGMGAGYTQFANNPPFAIPPFMPTEISGVGMPLVEASCQYLVQVPVAEGQIDTSGLPAGLYCLVLKPGKTNVLQNFDCTTFDIAQPFALPVDVDAGDTLDGDSIVFEVVGGACDANVTSVASVKAHGGGIGPLPVFYDPDVAGQWLVTETRDAAAPQQIVITFSTSVGPDGSLAGVSASGGMSVDTATLSDGGLTLTLDVSGAADGNAYTIDLSAALPDCPAGSETIVVRQCYGNTSGDNTINNIDKSQVAGKNGTAADATTCGDAGDELCAFLDVSLDGTINNIDKSAVAGLNGTACPAP